MTKKKVWLALAATGLLTLGSVAPVFAQDEMPADEGAGMEVPADPDSVGDPMADPGVDEGAGDASGTEAGDGTEGGEQQPE